MSPEQPERSVVRASDAERQDVVTRLQAAVGEGRLDLDEFSQRVDAAYSATTTAQLDALLADLPAPAAEVVGQRPPEQLTSVFGDVVFVAAAGVPGRIRTVFGDVRIDLRGLRTAAATVDLQLGTVFGDVDVVVSEGVAAELHGRTVFGDRKTQLAAVPRVPGTPRIVVTAATIFGDLRLRSLAPGESASRWRAVLDRLAGRTPQPPPSPPPP